MRVLHLGCGRKGSEDFGLVGAEVTTLDADPLLKPDIVCTLGRDPIPLPDDSVDLAIASHVLEHIGKQGETDAWFFFWEELYRVMVPGGALHFESPIFSSVWAWADPQHCRALSPQAFIYFAQDSYRIAGSAITPYRIKCDFEPPQPFEPVVVESLAAEEAFSAFRGVLQVKKPLKPWWEDVR